MRHFKKMLATRIMNSSLKLRKPNTSHVEANTTHLKLCLYAVKRLLLLEGARKYPADRPLSRSIVSSLLKRAWPQLQAEADAEPDLDEDGEEEEL